MNRQSLSAHFATFFLLSIAVVSTAIAQTETTSQPDVSYEAVLQLVSSTSGDPRGTELPQSLSGLSRRLKDDFGASSFRLSNTLIGRVANNGTVEYKSVSALADQTSAQPTFLDWSLVGLKRAETGDQLLHAQSFRFGARVPITTARIKAADGGSSDVTNYEHIGLTVNRLSVPLNKPTLVGTLTLPGSASTLFLVLTVRPSAY
ncbi:MAG: hypothetical protein LC730_03505 [Acidobacteria bacterium]|nr:hypothetical protein [Acidobacteriota bacterium]